MKAAMLEYNNQAFDDFNKKALMECKNCNRTFLPRPLEIHMRSCRPKLPNESSQVEAKPKRERRYLNLKRSTSPGKVATTTKSRIPTSVTGTATVAPPPTLPSIRPGTNKKSEDNGSSGGEDPPTREEIIARIEKDIAFSDPKICAELMEFVINLSQR